MDTEREFYFVSAPMTGYPHNNFPEVRRVVNALRATGINAVSPYLDYRDDWEPPASRSREGLEMLRYDLSLVMHPNCAGVVLLDGWAHSFGCTKEAYIAQTFGVPLLRYAEAEWDEGFAPHLEVRR